MEKDEQEYKKFLEDQLEWSKEQARILDKIDRRLREMKTIAEYARDLDLSLSEREKLNREFDQLKEEIQLLEKKMQSNVH